tara:strand:- start:68 stop:481 length:414 start_codon:yes stop_codon:yes gene_type:complete
MSSTTQSPPKRPRTEEFDMMPWFAEEALKRQLGRDDLTGVNLQKYAVIIECIYGNNTLAQDFGSRMWLVPCVLVDATEDDYYDFSIPGRVPGTLLSALLSDTYLLEESGNIAAGLMLSWAATAQLGDIRVIWKEGSF